MNSGRDERFMRLALREARRGRTSPNPHVGAVVARGDELIAVGHHDHAGGPHAEVVALERAGKKARGSTLYVTLEPCNHFGRTPPCTDAVLRSGVKRVVVGSRDPAPHVPGAIEKLRASGIQVDVGVLEDECRALVAAFTHHITTGLPFATLKAAVTLDGKIATKTGDSRWISNERSRREAHRMRSAADAVLVGVGTVLADDPELTVRHVRGQNPVRVVLDTRLRTPLDAKILRTNDAPTWVLHGPSRTSQTTPFVDRGCVLIEVPVLGKSLDLHAAFRELARRDVVNLLVEGGARVHGAVLDHDLASRVAVFVAPKVLGDADAPSWAGGVGVSTMSDACSLEHVRTRAFGGDVLIEGDLVRRPQRKP